MTLVRLATLLVGMLVLAGCASSSASRQHYTLATGDIRTAEDTAAAGIGSDFAYTLVLEPIQLANYLNHEGIALQLDDITMTRANDHLWAERLDRQLRHNLKLDLERHLPDTRVITTGSTLDKDAMTLSVDVERFQGRYDGQAIAAGQWQLKRNNTLLGTARFETSSELDSDGYPALVRALGRSWDEFADQLARQIHTLRR
ncbi:PqiC family protein [Pistricoccus aurantiacus]|nr:ABC-type transport auxiliary lipoprotein family protein [Pistricoccus aurantiacus]